VDTGGPAARNRAVVARFYDIVWNQWNLAAADELIAEDVRFRGSLGTRVFGINGFRRYVEQVRAAFPDFHNQVDDFIADGEKIVARLTCTGTHRGELFGIPPTGSRVTYAAVAILALNDAKIQDAYVVGDTQEISRALRSTPPEHAA
jgi:steroid delta-isomerase-like uncharacterized protein